MKKGLSEIVVVLDESGSMSFGKKDTIGGFNEFLRSQKSLEGEANFTFVKFSNYYHVINEGTPIAHAAELNESNYTPSASTALLDAVGQAINSVGNRLKKLPTSERAETVIFAVITDGEENSSREFTRSQITEMIKHQQEKYNWEFLFLGADVEAWGAEIGIYNNVSFSKADMGRSMKGMAYYTSNMRMGSVATSMDNFTLSEDDLDKELAKMPKK